jgi:hypothetical protein
MMGVPKGVMHAGCSSACVCWMGLGGGVIIVLGGGGCAQSDISVSGSWPFSALTGSPSTAGGLVGVSSGAFSGAAGLPGPAGPFTTVGAVSSGRAGSLGTDALPGKAASLLSINARSATSVFRSLDEFKLFSAMLLESPWAMSASTAGGASDCRSSSQHIYYVMTRGGLPVEHRSESSSHQFLDAGWRGMLG